MVCDETLRTTRPDTSSSSTLPSRPRASSSGRFQRRGRRHDDGFWFSGDRAGRAPASSPRPVACSADLPLHRLAARAPNPASRSGHSGVRVIFNTIPSRFDSVPAGTDWVSTTSSALDWVGPTDVSGVGNRAFQRGRAVAAYLTAPSRRRRGASTLRHWPSPRPGPGPVRSRMSRIHRCIRYGPETAGSAWPILCDPGRTTDDGDRSGSWSVGSSNIFASGPA